MCVFGGEKKTTVEEVGEKDGEYKVWRLLSASPRGPSGVTEGWARGSQSHQYQSELHLHAECKEMQCEHVSSNVSNRCQ